MLLADVPDFELDALLLLVDLELDEAALVVVALEAELVDVEVLAAVLVLVVFEAVDDVLGLPVVEVLAVE